MEKPSIEVFRQFFTFDPVTGDLRWKRRHHHTVKPDLSLRTDSKGYKAAYFGRKNYSAHRIAWAIHYGAWPSGQIDHINGDRTDNRIANLRDVSPAENRKNTKIDRRNLTGVSGVRFRPDRNVWEAYIRVDGKLHYLGRFENFVLAAAVRRDAERHYGFHPNHGRAA